MCTCVIMRVCVASDISNLPVIQSHKGVLFVERAAAEACLLSLVGFHITTVKPPGVPEELGLFSFESSPNSSSRRGKRDKRGSFLDSCGSSMRREGKQGGAGWGQVLGRG